MAMKSHDVIVSLKLALDGSELSYAQLSHDICISVAEVHAAVRRLQEGKLVRPGNKKVMMKPLLNFIEHGLSVVFPAVMGEPTRGMPTAWAAPVMKSLIRGTGEEIPVWPDAQGTVRGNRIEPLHPSEPKAAAADSELYAMLALVDAIRIGRARERNIAIIELGERLKQNE